MGGQYRCEVAVSLVPADRITDPDWLAGEVAAGAARWATGDIRLLATLWWYGASIVLVTPSLVSWVRTGTARSPRLGDLVLHRVPGGLDGADSTADLGSDLTELGVELRRSLGVAVDGLARLTGRGPAPLWALATDAVAGRLLWAGEATGRVDAATAAAVPLVAAMGADLPPPRYVDVLHRRFVQRVSCCQVYRVPGGPLCVSCPRRSPADRAALLREVAR